MHKYSTAIVKANIIKFTYIDKLSNYFPINDKIINPNNESGERKKKEKNNFPLDRTPNESVTSVRKTTHCRKHWEWRDLKTWWLTNRTTHWFTHSNLKRQHRECPNHRTLTPAQLTEILDWYIVLFISTVNPR